jgi:hypothetical protein
MASENPDAVRWASTGPDGPGTVPVSGIVRDPAGRPVAGALVTATSLDRPPRPVPELAVFTDPAGRYDWPSLAPAGTKCASRPPPAPGPPPRPSPPPPPPPPTSGCAR